MFDEVFADGHTLIHRVDPRFRLAALILGAACLAVLQRAECAAAGLMGSAALLALSRPPLGPLFRRVLAVNGFIAFVWITVPATMPGEPVISCGLLSFSRQGVELAVLVTLKSNAILCLCLALAATMPSPTLGSALHSLRCPSKLVFLFLFTCRYIHVIAHEQRRLSTAARLRGFAPRTSLHSYRTLSRILGMVLARSHDHAIRIHEAMILRGFDGSFQSVAAFHAARADGLFLAVTSAALISLALLDRFPEVFGV
ncbi:MAG: cobalt ECF transporter T component CbiQ [Desulfovibrionaceae bacterium]|nr:cobalt ECF transporter T component CbiQ [Desulfovibrionaceae bacterium]